MSAAQILEELKSYPMPELEALEQELRLERLRRARRGLSARETALHQIINEPMPDIERYQQLSSWKKEKRHLETCECRFSFP